MGQEDKPLRADAVRNRNALLAAARRVFAAQGLDAPLELIAAEAGVSRATQHRHFPTRDVLVRAIFDDNLEALEQVVQEASDPSDAYVAMLLAMVGQMAESRGFLDLLTRRVHSIEIPQEIGDRFIALVAEPLRVAQAAGRVRDDLRPEDTVLLADMLGAATRPKPGYPADGFDRGIALVLESIQPEPRVRLGGG